jgi:type IV secretory pathway TraG/TraD family ATPase VirD4
MDREFTWLRKALKENLEGMRWFAENHLVPFFQECVHFISAVLQVIIKSFATPDHSYKSEFVEGNDVLSTKNTGFVIDGRRKQPSKADLMHLIVTGQSGAGKSTVAVLGSIMEVEGSKVIVDPSKELFLQTSGYLAQQGYKIKVIDFGNPTVSDGYNPFERIRTSTDAQKVASMLVRNVLKNQGDAFWLLSATSLLTLLIRALQHQPKEYRHFGNVRSLLMLLNADGKAADRIIAQTGDVQLINEYKSSFLANDPKLRQSIVATVSAATSLWSDPYVTQVTSVDTLNMDELRKTKTALYINCPSADATFYSSLISILFEQLAKEVMNSLPKKGDLRTYFILDEFSSLYIQSIGLIISNIRKHGGALMIICQDISQITDIYGQSQSTAIIANCYSKLYFSGVSHATAVNLSAQLGKYQFEDKNNIQRIRELLTPSEIRTLSKGKAIFIHGNSQPILLDTTPIYEHPYWKLRLKISSPKLISPLPVDGPKYSQ